MVKPHKILFSFLFTALYLILVLPSPARAASLSLSPSTGSFGRNCNFSIDVTVDTQNVETDGADVILLYDPSLINAMSIVNGTIYNDYPGNTIDNSSGKVSIYALASPTKGFIGRGKVASVNFNTSATSSATLASIKIDFDPANPTKTTDSNLIERATLKDVLSSVTNGSYTLGSGSGCQTAVSPGSVAVGVGGPTTTLPDSGAAEVTWVIGGLGLLLTILGSLGLNKYRLGKG